MLPCRAGAAPSDVSVLANKTQRHRGCFLQAGAAVRLGTLVWLATSAAFAQEPRPAQRSATQGERGGVAAGLGLDMLQRRATSDDWLLHHVSEYERDDSARLNLQVTRALELARRQKKPAFDEVAVDTDADARPDAWVYFENAAPAFVEFDSQGTLCHDLRVDIRRKPWSFQKHRYWFIQPPLPLATEEEGPLALKALYDLAAPLPPHVPSNDPLLALAKQTFPTFIAESTALAKATADAALAKRLAEMAQRAQALLPKFAEIHRQDGLEKKLKIYQGVRIDFRPYDLDGVEGSEVVAGYAPWGIECIQFHKTDWLEGFDADKGARAKATGKLGEVFFKDKTVARVDLDGRRYFPLGTHWLRTSDGARRPLAEKLLLPAYHDYRAGRWYEAVARWRQAVEATVLLGDLRLGDRGQPVGSLEGSGAEGWSFSLKGIEASVLFEFGRTMAARGDFPEIFSLAAASAAQGNEAEALELYALAIRFADKGSKTLKKVLALERMSALHQRLGNYDRSIECLFQSLDLESSLGYSTDVIENLRIMAQHPDDPTIMKRNMEMRTHAMAVNRCCKLGTIAAHYVDLGDLERAKNYLSEAQRLAPPLGNRYLEADLMCLHAKLELAEGRSELALERLRRAYQIVERQSAEQQKSSYGLEMYQKGESIHSFQIVESQSRFEVDMRAATHPLAYQALAAGLLAEACMQRAVELKKTDAAQATRYLAEAKDWQTKALKFSQTAADSDGQLVGQLRLAAIAAQEGNYALALTSAKRVADQSRTEGKFETLWRALSLAGAAHQARGESAQAIAAYEAAAKEIESLRARLRSEPVRRGFFGSKIDVYEELARLYLAAPPGRDEAARSAAAQQVWQCIERAKARTLLDTVGGQPLKLKGDAVGEAQRQAPLLLPAALRSPASEDDAGEALAAIADRPLLQEVASFSAVQPASLAALAAVLGPRDVLIEFFATRDELLAAVVSQGKLELVPLPGFPAEGLRVEVENFRRQIEDPRGIYEPLARSLYDRLLAPCLAGRSKVERICIVPGGSLHYLPFAALVVPDGKFLIERCPVFTAPSASALVYAYHRRSGEASPLGGNALVVADPLPQMGFSPLPYAAREGKEVHGLSRESPPLLSGKEATETAIVAALADARCFHFAGHTHLPPASPLRAALMCTEDLDRDGRLEVREILELNLRRCELAVLSACETRLGRWSRGDEIVGLERAFLRAGVPTVVTSLWKVDDAATQALMVEFYKNLWSKKQGKLDSLQAAQLALLDGRLKPEVDKAVRALGAPLPLPDGGKTTSSTRHPRYWAAFVLSGDWR